MGDNVVNIVVEILSKNKAGLTITDIVNLTKLSRSAVRTALARLEGARMVVVRNIGMAKVYILRGKR